jgi:ParB family transcriptional regulator, chromosome partitioning protein
VKPPRPGSGHPGALGRGLASLIPDTVRHASAPGGPSLLRVPLDAIVPNPEQPRANLVREELESLAVSIRENGLLQPVLVSEDPSRPGRFVLVAGERRWRAAGLAGLVEIPVLLTERARDPKDHLLFALVENLQRSDLGPVDEARGYRRLQEAFGFTQEEIASRVGKDRTTVTNSLRLLKLPQVAIEALREGGITTGHAKVLLSLHDPARIPTLVRAIEQKALSVRALERLVALANASGTTHPVVASGQGRYRPVEELLGHSLGTRVTIRTRSDGGGRIVISYGSKEELTALVERLRGQD